MDDFHGPKRSFQMLEDGSTIEFARINDSKYDRNGLPDRLIASKFWKRMACLEKAIIVCYKARISGVYLVTADKIPNIWT